MSHPSLSASDSNRITAWLMRLRRGDREAPQVIWDRYYERLTRLARKRLNGIGTRVADEEDVALSALKSFFRGVDAGRFPELTDSESLWKVLVTLTVRKTLTLRRRQLTIKRGGGNVRGDSVLRSESQRVGFDQFAGNDVGPELHAAFSEQVAELLHLLSDQPTLQDVALLKLAGYRSYEIAEQIGRHQGTVRRKIRTVQKIWSDWLKTQAEEDYFN